MSRGKVTVSVRNGIIYVQGYIDGIRYRKSTKRKATKANLAWVQKHASDVLLKLIDKQCPEDRDYTVEEFGFKSLEMNALHRKSNTNRDYHNHFKRNILPYFANYKLQELKASDLKLWQTKLAKKGLSGKSIKNARGVFSGILRDAYRDELIDKDIFQLVKPPKLKEPEINPFSLEEATCLIQHAEGWFKNYLIIAFFTGMRVGEIIGLRWKDINFDDNLISIKQAISQGVIDTPKTKSSIREIDMLKSVKTALINQYALTGKKKEGYVFLTKHNKHYQRAESITSHAWKPLISKCNIEYRILYQTRHTFASVMIQQGEEIGWVSMMLGHKNIGITLSKYARFIKRRETQRAEFLDELQI